MNTQSMVVVTGVGAKGDTGASGAAPGITDGGAPFTLHDTFDGTAGTALTSHTPPIGSGWVASSGTAQLTGSSGAIRADASANPTIQTIAAGCANFDIEFSVSIPNQAGVRGGVILRYIDSTNFLWVRTDESGMKLMKRVAGTDSTVYGWDGTALINTTKQFRAEVRGASVSFFESVNGFVGNWTLTDAEAATYGASTTVGWLDIASTVPARFITFNHFAVRPFAQLSLLSAANKVVRASSGIVAKLAAGTDASILVISDSTTDETTEWAYRFCQKADADSTYGVNYHRWASLAWPAATVVSAGTPKLVMMNTATASQGAQFFIDNWATVVSGIPATPDAVIISLGHNDPFDSTLKPLYRTLIATIRASYASAPIVLVFQDPHQVNPYFTTYRRLALYELALELNLEHVDVWFRFGGITPDPQLYLGTTDAVHPSITGSKAWAGLIYRTMFPDGINPV